MWTATIDFTKAFDSITHKSIWDALKSCGIEHDYISLLKKLYRDQEASVLADEESNMFEIKKGTKQGDPLLSLLSESTGRRHYPRWQKKKGMGIFLSDNDHQCLTNMRFAENVLRFASSKEKLLKMLCEFKRSTGKVGLRIHPGKMKILINQSLNTRKEMEIDGIKVEILTREERTKYLGQMITFQQQETTEIRNQKSNQGCLGNCPQV